jgi:2-iminoacetate synthase
MPDPLSVKTGDFIDDARMRGLLEGPPPEGAQVLSILEKSLAKEPLGLEETATLLRVQDPELIERLFAAARSLKETVYGNRVVLFAPLYVGNLCVNDCLYCGFRRSNAASRRVTLTGEEVRDQVEALERAGQKRLILVFGEHPAYGPEFIARTVREVYAVRTGPGTIRRVNINAAPLTVEGFRTVKEAGIGTYQIFQETYDHTVYARVHPAGTNKGDYPWRLLALDRAMEAGCEDVGIGALFGLADWRFEVLGLVAHSLHFTERFGVGPHTISVPRLRPASGAALNDPTTVDDEAFKRVVAILRLAVPYTGLILTAREPEDLRRTLMSFGVSQIDAGTRLELGGYTESAGAQCLEREQFELADERPLDLVIRDLLADGHTPSFCTACYRLGRTGEHFMEFAVPGFIQNFCTPNALITLLEYLLDYAPPETCKVGEERIARELQGMPPGPAKEELVRRLERVRAGERDLLF